jgi:hypothetical protein
MLAERPYITNQMAAASFDELTMLKQQAGFHEDALKDLKERIAELEAQPPAEAK